MISLVLTILLYITSLLLIVVILLQPHKSDGVTSTESTIFGLSVDNGPLPRVTAILVAMLALIIAGMHYFA